MDEVHNWSNVHWILTHKQTIDLKWQEIWISNGRGEVDAPYTKINPLRKYKRTPITRLWIWRWQQARESPIRYLIWKQIKTTQHKSVGVGMVSIIEKQQCASTRDLGCTVLVNNPPEDSLTSFFCLFTTKFYIETILIPQTDNIIKEDSIFFVKFPLFIWLWILITSHTG